MKRFLLINNFNFFKLHALNVNIVCLKTMPKLKKTFDRQKANLKFNSKIY